MLFLDHCAKYEHSSPLQLKFRHASDRSSLGREPHINILKWELDKYEGEWT